MSLKRALNKTCWVTVQAQRTDKPAVTCTQLTMFASNRGSSCLVRAPYHAGKLYKSLHYVVHMPSEQREQSELFQVFSQGPYFILKHNLSLCMNRRKETNSAPWRRNAWKSREGRVVLWWCLVLLSSAGDELGNVKITITNMTAARKDVHYCKARHIKTKLNKQ